MALTGPLDRSTFDVVLIEIATGEVTPLLSGPENDRAAQFCDEDTVVFTRQTDPANSDLWTIDTDGGNLTRLTDSPGLDSFATCSPGGQRIAFISSRSGVPAIWEIDRDGGSPRLLVPGVDPDYAPDGSALAYAAADPVDGNPEIFTLDLATGAVVQRTHTPPPVQNRLPHYAPSFGSGVVPARTPLQGPVPLWLLYTQILPDLEFPEQNLALVGAFAKGGPAVPCNNPPPASPECRPTRPRVTPAGRRTTAPSTPSQPSSAISTASARSPSSARAARTTSLSA